jgi:hypothetical protein
MRVMEPAAFIMTRRMLLGLKQRAEGSGPRHMQHLDRTPLFRGPQGEALAGSTAETDDPPS